MYWVSFLREIISPIIVFIAQSILISAITITKVAHR